MKTYLLLFSLLISITALSAQCELENNSFEDWSTVTLEGDGITSTDVMLPDSIFPAARFLFFAFSGPQIIDSILTSDPAGFLGLEQSTDASDGELAVKLQSKYADQVDFADLYYFNSCSEVPDSFAVDIKHVGFSDTDNISFGVAFSEGLPSLFDDPETLPYVGANLYDITEDTEYVRYVVPIEENFESVVDTFYYSIFAQTTDSTYFVVDNVEFIYGEPSSIDNQEILSNVSILENPAQENLSITLGEPINIPVDLLITDLTGKSYLSKSFNSIQSNLEFNISDLPSGSYNLQLRSREGISTLKFIKI